MVSIMTSLWFDHLNPQDKVAVKPHASPVYHAIKYLTGELDRSYLTTLRQRGGLQAYPSRTKDPDVSDFSTGSVGLGAVAPLFSALTRRYVDSHFADQNGADQNGARFIALVGDAELDEGSVWEAIADPATRGLGNFTMVVDLNRQSLDRVIPDIAATRLRKFFADAGWHVAEAKWGRLLQKAFTKERGDALKAHIESMSNEAYQSLLTLNGDEFIEAFLKNADSSVKKWMKNRSPEKVQSLVHDLGGHDLTVLKDCYQQCDAEQDRPSVLFAYTVKGWGLPIAGDPLNHAALLNDEQIEHLRFLSGVDDGADWDRFDPDSDAGRLCHSVGSAINNPEPTPRPLLTVPRSTRPVVRTGKVSTQEAFGRSLAALSSNEELGPRIVTTAPDVSISTNLGGWINKTGVYSHVEREAYGGDKRVLKWAPSPTGQHIELGISEMNLFMLLGQLGLSHDHHGEQLIPIGTVYDPFVLRGLDAFIYSIYNDARFIVTGTPSGVTLAPEGGAHQSTITASVGLELPNLHYIEPAFAGEVEWLLADAIEQIAAPDGASTYLRLSTRPIDQKLFGDVLDRIGEERLRRLVISGGYRLIESPSVTDPEDPLNAEDHGEDRPAVTIVTTGAMAPEAAEAAAELELEGVSATVVHLTSPGRVYDGWRQSYTSVSAGAVVGRPSHIHRLIPASERDRPVISVQDAASHSLAWIGSALGARQFALGVDRFGESGTIADLHEITGISAGSIVNAALVATSS